MNPHQPLYEALIAIGYTEEKAKEQAIIPNAELVYELVRSQNHTNDLIHKVLDKLDDMSTEQKTIKNEITSLGTQHRETDAKMIGKFAEINTRISQLDKQIQELKDQEEA